MQAPIRSRPGTPHGNAARLFGYDVFISFALGAPPRGSRSYASDLARRLRERDYTVFFSEDEAPAGGQLDDGLKRALARSRILVVIANRDTLADPRWVRVEVEEFRRRHPKRPVIPINIGGALQDPRHGAAAQAWLQFAGRIWIDDTEAACEHGIVSDEALERLVTAPTAVRASARWRWTARTAFGVLAGVTAAALWFAWSDRLNAELARTNEANAVANADRASANAELAGSNEARAVANAESARRESERAQRAEGEALREAEAARAAERRARSGRLAAESQLARGYDPALALLLAREAWATDRIPEARRALYEALFDPVPLVLGQGLGELRYVSYSSNGLHVAASSGDSRVHLWRIDDPGPARVVSTAAGVRALAFSPDGRHLVTLDARARLQFWDPVTGMPHGEAAAIAGLRAGWTMAWRSDGAQLAVTGYDDVNEQIIVLWDPLAGRASAEPFKLPSNFGIFRLALSPSGKRLAATVSNQIHVWDLGSRQLVVPPIAARVATRFVAFTDEDRIIFDGPGYEATAWSLWSNIAERPSYSGHSTSVQAFAHSRVARLVATGSEDGSIRVWNANQASIVDGSLGRHGWGVNDLAFSPDGLELVSVARDGQVVRWLLATNAHRHRKAAQAAPRPDGADVTRSNDLTWTALLLKDGHLEWHGPAGVQRAGSAPPRAEEGLAVARDGSLALRAADDTLSVHAAGKAQHRCTIAEKVRYAGFSPDNRLLVTWSDKDPTLRLWTAVDCRPIASIERQGEDARFRAVTWSADSRRLWIAGEDSIRSWNVLARRYDPGAGLVAERSWHVATDPAGRYLAASVSEGGVRLFDLKHGGRPLDLTGAHSRSTVRALAISPDGQWLASATDYSHALWDLTTGQLAGRPVANRQGQLRGIAFAADGQTLVTSSTDGPDQHWELDAGVWAERACETAHRNLTCSEWQRLMGESIPYRRTCPQWPLPADGASCGVGRLR
jgi:WD40 repeat protein